MILAISLVVAVVFGSGAFLILQRDLFRVVVGIVLISNAAFLFIIAAGQVRGAAPILPLQESSSASDPLVQAMALTAIVISLSTVALLLSLIYRLYTAHETVDLSDISEAERRYADALEREKVPGEESEEEPMKEEPVEEEEIEEKSR